MLKFDKKITSKKNSDQYYKADKLWLSQAFTQGLCIHLQTWHFRRSLEIMVKKTLSSSAPIQKILNYLELDEDTIKKYDFSFFINAYICSH
jgi:hypothetical protein